MNSIKIEDIQKIYFLGIGGIGMSAIARYFVDKGAEVHGYDLVKTPLTTRLESEGMIIHYEDNTKFIPEDVDLVVWTPAIPTDLGELIWCKAKGWPLMKRAEVLGLLSKACRTVAIAGTHGKTTTSSIIAHVLNSSGKKCTAFLGGILTEEGSNYMHGDSDIVVLEADEYDKSFLHLEPEILAIISLDADHLDIYGSVEEMRSTYEQLTYQIKSGGLLVLGPDVYRHLHYNWEQRLRENNVRVVRIFEDFDFDNIIVLNNRYHYSYLEQEYCINNMQSNLPGLHNILNSSVAVKICRELGVENKVLKSSLASFKGIKRRFEIVYNGRRKLLDDYAHHPEELRYAINTVNELYPDKKILGVFQPHLYSRTLDFYRDFGDVLSGLSASFILPIYPARELPIDGVDSSLIYNLIACDDKYLVGPDDVLKEIAKRQDCDVIITLGAADIDKYHKGIIELIRD